VIVSSDTDTVLADPGRLMRIDRRHSESRHNAPPGLGPDLGNSRRHRPVHAPSAPVNGQPAMTAPKVRPIGTLTEPLAAQQSVKVARGATVNPSCIWHEDSLVWQAIEA
jgi:hypothetical protein